MRNAIGRPTRLLASLPIILQAAFGPLPIRAAERRFFGSLESDSATAIVIDRGLRESDTLRGLLEAIDEDEATRLRVVIRFQPSSFVRAHSDLRIERGDLVRRDGRTIRVDAVVGEIVLPPDARDDVKLADLGHELAHVVVELGGCLPRVAAADEETLAVAVERAIAAELDRSAGRRPGAGAPSAPRPPLPACLAPSSAARALMAHFGIEATAARATDR